MSNVRLSTATHEAGHAVIARALGLDVAFVSIVPEPGSLGRLELASGAQGSDEQRALVRLAGGLACRSWNVDEGGCLRDLDEARAYAITDAEGDEARADRLLDAWGTTASELVARHGFQIGECSIALLERETITGAELDEIMSRVAVLTWD